MAQRLTGSVLSSGNFEELLDICDFARHGCGFCEVLYLKIKCQCVVVAYFEIIVNFGLSQVNVGESVGGDSDSWPGD